MIKSNEYFVYILLCNDGTFYVGKTNNLKKRLRQHNGKITGGAKYTKNKRPVTLFYFEKFTLHLDAARREIALKKFTHEKKKNLGIKIDVSKQLENL